MYTNDHTFPYPAFTEWCIFLKNKQEMKRNYQTNNFFYFTSSSSMNQNC